MADEIAQVISMEIQGMKFVVEASLAAARLFFTILKWFLSDRYAQGHVLPGETSPTVIFKMSQPDGPATLMTDRDEVMIDQIREQATKMGLHFHVGDFNKNNTKVTFFTTPKEAGALQSIIQQCAKEKKEEMLQGVARIDKDIKETEALFQFTKDPEEIKALNVTLENLKKSREESETKIRSLDEIINSEDMHLGFNEFLGTLKGSEFERDPDKAFTALCEHNMGQPPEFNAKEAFQPVRNECNAPKNGVTYYLPEYGCKVTREFKKDDKNCIYSIYHIITKDGEHHQFSDRNMTDAEWNKNVLPKIYDTAGFLEDTIVRAFSDPNVMVAFAKKYPDLKPKSDERVQEMKKNGVSPFQNEKQERLMKNEMNEFQKRKAYDNINRDSCVIWIDTPILKGGYLEANIDGETFKFTQQDMTKDPVQNEYGQRGISFSSDMTITLESKDGHTRKITAGALAEEIKEKANARAIAAMPTEEFSMGRRR